MAQGEGRGPQKERKQRCAFRTAGILLWTATCTPVAAVATTEMQLFSEAATVHGNLMSHRNPASSAVVRLAPMPLRRGLSTDSSPSWKRRTNSKSPKSESSKRSKRQSSSKFLSQKWAKSSQKVKESKANHESNDKLSKTASHASKHRSSKTERRKKHAKKRPKKSKPREKSQVVQERVVGGTEIEEGRYPYLVAVFRRLSDDQLQHVCGGSLVETNVVLSSAHCVSMGAALARIGLHDIRDFDESQGMEEFEIMDEIIHPQYDGIDADFVLFVLNGDSTFAKVSLNTRWSHPDDGDELTVMGWGSERTDGVESTVPLEAGVQSMSNGECNDAYGSVLSVTSNMICCDSSAGNDACEGDSGGPLVTKGGSNNEDVLVGVVSTGMNCGDEEYPGVYGRVSSVIDWIEESLEEIAENEQSLKLGQTPTVSPVSPSTPESDPIPPSVSPPIYSPDPLPFPMPVAPPISASPSSSSPAPLPIFPPVSAPNSPPFPMPEMGIDPTAGGDGSSESPTLDAGTWSPTVEWE